MRIALAAVAAVVISACGGGGGGGGGGDGPSGPGGGGGGGTVVAPPFSSGKWNAPATFGPQGIPPWRGLAVDLVGTTHFVFSDLTGPPTPTVTVRWLRQALLSAWEPDQALTATIAVPAAETRAMQHTNVRVDSAGNAFAVWSFRDHSFLTDRDFTSNVQVARRDAATGVWDAPQVLQNDPAAYADQPVLVVEPSGTAWLTWTERTFKAPIFGTQDQFAIFAARYVPGSGWQAPEKISADFLWSLSSRLSTDGQGNPHVVFAHNSGIPLTSTLYSTRRPAGGPWTAPVQIAQAVPTGGLAPNYSEYDIASDGDGDAIVMWREYDGTRHVILSRHFTVAGGWEAPLLLMVPSPDSGFAPQLAMDTNGNAFVVWHEFDGSAYGIWAARFVKGAGWTLLQVINSVPEFGGDDSTEPKIGFDAAGNAVAVWSKYEFAENRPIVRSSYFSSSTGWGPDETISGGQGIVWYPQLAVSPGGYAKAIWWEEVNNLFHAHSATRVP